MVKKIFSRSLLVLVVIFAGCSCFDLARDIQLSSYMQKKQHRLFL